MQRHPIPLLLMRTTCVSAGILGAILGLVWYISQRVNPIPRRDFADFYTFTPWELGVPYEELTFLTSDEVTLRGWWLARPETTRVVVGCHGHLGSKDDLLGIGAGLWRAGHNVLLFDFRGRGESDPWPNTLVSREVEDLLTVIAYVQRRVPSARIGMMSFSMGAVVAILAAAREPAIATIVADSPFTSAAEVVAHGIQGTIPFATPLLLALTEAMIVQLHGYRLSQVRPIDVIGQLAPRPLLLIHASQDSVIPVDHAYRLFAAAGEPKELWVCEGAEHCGAYFADRHAYVQRVGAFFSRHLGSSEQQ